MLSPKTKALINTAALPLVIVIIIAGASYTLIKVNKYEQWRYDSHANTYPVNISTFAFNAYQDCGQKQKNSDRSSCYKSVERVLNSSIPIANIIAQDIVAQATKGLLRVSAIQAIVAMLTTGLRVWTVIQTRGILGEARNTTAAANKSLTATKINNAPGFILEIDIKNIGKTPANNILIKHEGRAIFTITNGSYSETYNCDVSSALQHTYFLMHGQKVSIKFNFQCERSDTGGGLPLFTAAGFDPNTIVKHASLSTITAEYSDIGEFHRSVRKRANFATVYFNYELLKEASIKTLSITEFPSSGPTQMEIRQWTGDFGEEVILGRDQNS